jgi:hypothetical protein
VLAAAVLAATLGGLATVLLAAVTLAGLGSLATVTLAGLAAAAVTLARLLATVTLAAHLLGRGTRRLADRRGVLARDRHLLLLLLATAVTLATDLRHHLRTTERKRLTRRPSTTHFIMNPRLFLRRTHGTFRRLHSELLSRGDRLGPKVVAPRLQPLLPGIHMHAGNTGIGRIRDE